jgi:FAD/FMN-containing dehydrogenase
MEPGSEAADAHVGWAKELSANMAPETTTGVYLNFTSDQGEERVRSAYGPDKYARLVALKDEHDPANLFRLNQNIKPSANGG